MEPTPPPPSNSVDEENSSDSTKVNSFDVNVDIIQVNSTILRSTMEPTPHPSSNNVDEENSSDATQVNSFDINVDMDVNDINDNNEILPTNVCTEDQLSSLPMVCLNQNSKSKRERPLRHVDEHGNASTYALNPMLYSVIFILLVELLERFSFYGLNYTMTSFLTGAYDDRKFKKNKSLPPPSSSSSNTPWNANMSAISASSMVSISTAVAYSTPFAGAILADCYLGEYKAMLVGSLCFYLPGLLLILASSVPHFGGMEKFNRTALSVGLLGLWPIGTGIVKSIVNVFGAKQFHPLLQSSMIESYYVKFYMCINIGALVGGIVVPLAAQRDVTQAYTFPVAMLLVGTLLFVFGTPRYVRNPPSGDLLKGIEWFQNGKNKNNTKKSIASSLSSTSSLLTIFKISALIIPFNIAYSQMATTFIIQGNVMKRAFGWIDAASMNNADAIAVLAFGHFVGSYLYPYLNLRGIKLSTTNKFAIGSALGALAIAWALLIEHKIHSQYISDGKKVSILWQTLAYILIGAGEIFAVSAAYEVAFTASPPEKKVLASALNLFCVGGIPNLLCLFLYNVCRGWFVPTNENSNGSSILNLEDYVSAYVYKYFLVLFVVALSGVIINLLPSVQNYVQSVEDAATESIKTPILKTPLAQRRRDRKQSNTKSNRGKVQYERQISEDNSMSTVDDTEEELSSFEASPLIRLQRHKAYLKYGSGPELYKSGSMRAGPSFLRYNNSRNELSDECGNRTMRIDERNYDRKALNKHQVGWLYRNTSKKTNNSESKYSVVSSSKQHQAGIITKSKRKKFRPNRQNSH